MTHHRIARNFNPHDYILKLDSLPDEYPLMFIIRTAERILSEWLAYLELETETILQEMRACPGLETMRGGGRSTELRAPMLFGLYALVVLVCI